MGGGGGFKEGGREGEGRGEEEEDIEGDERGGGAK